MVFPFPVKGKGLGLGQITAPRTGLVGCVVGLILVSDLHVASGPVSLIESDFEAVHDRSGSWEVLHVEMEMTRCCETS